MSKPRLVLRRDKTASRSLLAVLSMAVLSLLELGAESKADAPNLFWPIVGIAAVLITAFIASRLVRGDPYYDQNASRDQRDRGGLPLGDGDGGA